MVGRAYSGNFANSGTLTLPLAGTYTLLLEGNVSANGAAAYTFNVTSQGHVAPPVLTGSGIAFDTTTSGAISVAGEIDDYVFTITGPTRIYIDSLTNNGLLSWRLVGPRGTERGPVSFTNTDYGNTNAHLDLTAPGTYQLQVSGSASATGSYSLRLLDLADAVPLVLGTLVSATLTPGNATHVYRFEASAGDRLYLDGLSASSGNIYWRLLDSRGSVVAGTTLPSDMAPAPLDRSGTYTLLIEGFVQNSAPSNYSFNVVRVVDTTEAISIGTQVDGALTQPGQTNSFTFTLAEAGHFAFDSLTNNSQLLWTLTGPRGTEVLNRGFTSSDGNSVSNPVLSLVGGAYTLTVTSVNAAIGSYSFRLLDLSAAASASS